MLRHFKNDKTFLSAKFQFSVIQFVKVISNKPFFLLKALNPGLKLLEVVVVVIMMLTVTIMTAMTNMEVAWPSSWAPRFEIKKSQVQAFSSATPVNSQLVCLVPVGIFNVLCLI